MIKRTRKFLKKHVQKIKSRLKSKSKSFSSCNSGKILRGGRSKYRTKLRKSRTRVHSKKHRKVYRKAHTKIHRKRSAKRSSRKLRSKRGGGIGGARLPPPSPREIFIESLKILKSENPDKFDNMFVKFCKDVSEYPKLEGIFRLAGNNRKYKEFMEDFNLDYNLSIIEKAEIIKRMTFVIDDFFSKEEKEQFNEFVQSSKTIAAKEFLDEKMRENIKLNSLINCLDTIEFYSEENKMTSTNIEISFGESWTINNNNPSLKLLIDAFTGKLKINPISEPELGSEPRSNLGPGKQNKKRMFELTRNNFLNINKPIHEFEKIKNDNVMFFGLKLEKKDEYEIKKTSICAMFSFGRTQKRNLYEYVVKFNDGEIIEYIYVFTDDENIIKGFILSEKIADKSKSGKIIFTNVKVLSSGCGVDINKATERSLEFKIIKHKAIISGSKNNEETINPVTSPKYMKMIPNQGPPPLYEQVYPSNNLENYRNLLIHNNKQTPIPIRNVSDNEVTNNSSTIRKANGKLTLGTEEISVNFDMTDKPNKLEKEYILGGGEFGKVIKFKVLEDSCPIVNHSNRCEGLVKNRDYVLKTLCKKSSDLKDTQIKELKDELKIFNLLHEHKDGAKFIPKNYGNDLWVIKLDNDNDLEAICDKEIPTPLFNYGFILDICTIGSLKDLLPKLELEDKLLYLEQVAEGIEYIHSKRIIHRDIAARNILICSHQGNEIAKITDFGLAEKLEQNKNNISNVIEGPNQSKTLKTKLSIKWLDPIVSKYFLTNKITDGWAFACTIFEVITNFIPYINTISREVLSILKSDQDKNRFSNNNDLATVYFCNIFNQISKKTQLDNEDICKQLMFPLICPNSSVDQSISANNPINYNIYDLFMEGLKKKDQQFNCKTEPTIEKQATNPPCYKGDLSKEDAEEKLSNLSNLYYLTRRSKTTGKDAITYKNQNGVVKHEIYNGNTKGLKCIDNLVLEQSILEAEKSVPEGFTTHPIQISNNEGDNNSVPKWRMNQIRPVPLTEEQKKIHEMINQRKFLGFEN